MPERRIGRRGGREGENNFLKSKLNKPKIPINIPMRITVKHNAPMTRRAVDEPQNVDGWSGVVDGNKGWVEIQRIRFVKDVGIAR